MTIDRSGFFAEARALFGGRYSQAQISGLNAVLDEWEKRLPGGDTRWLAYMLATAFHETARTMQPVREAFWLSEEWRRKNLRYYPYYGRGYVQLTWQDNYEKAGAYVGVNLAAKPDLALQPDHAAAIMFVGMGEGWFRGDRHGRRQTLARSFGPNVNDPVGAREIINGPEWKVIGGRRVLLAGIIAQYHATFLQAVGSGRTADAESAANASLSGHFEGALSNAAYTAFSEETLTVGVGPIDELGSMAAEASEVSAPSADQVLRYTVEIVTSYLNHNELNSDDVPTFITKVHTALGAVSAFPLLSHGAFDREEEDAPNPPKTRTTGDPEGAGPPRPEGRLTDRKPKARGQNATSMEESSSTPG